MDTTVLAIYWHNTIIIIMGVTGLLYTQILINTGFYHWEHNGTISSMTYWHNILVVIMLLLLSLCIDISNVRLIKSSNEGTELNIHMKGIPLPYHTTDAQSGLFNIEY